ncbi:MAG: U32 family peptidase [Spirochaetaceae bacterium]|jgi:putative protease|nr:U32 family peptidase [Spirochaetaceae bacterium]
MELLSPAGTPEALDAAIASGADAVYLGLKSFNARLRSANFAYSQFEAAVKVLHSQNRKVYVTVNTVFEERETDRMYQLLKYLASVGPDALIVQDYGVVEMARRYFPSLKLHASTQMNIASARGAHFLSKYGVSRIVLARELSFDEVKAIRGNTNAEMEVFVHGALCVSVSSLCLFSSYLGGKSANRGMCTQACRRFYRTSPDEPSESGYFFSPRDLQLIDRVPLLHEAGINALKIEGRMKSAEYVGTVTRAYRLVIDACVSGGEGAIKDAIAEAEAILHGDYARRKTRYHFDMENKEGEASPSLRSTPSATPSAGDNPRNTPESRAAPIGPEGALFGLDVLGDNGGSPFGGPAAASLARGVLGGGGGSPFGGMEASYLDSKENGGTGIRLGTIKKKRGNGNETAVFIPIHGSSRASGYDSAVKNAAQVMAGDSLRFHRADDSKRATHKAAFVEREKNGAWVSVPEGFDAGDIVYLIQRKAASRRYPPLLPKNLNPFRKAPGRDKAPEIDLEAEGKKARKEIKTGKKNAALFPAGLYAAVENVADLYIAQSVKTQGVILPFKEKNVQAFLGDRASHSGGQIPYRPDQVVISMPPFFPESQTETAEKGIRRLVERGYTRFIVNNLGQIAMLKKVNAALVAGPFLYTFNRYGAAFLRNAGLSFFVSPYENARQNLERVFGGKPGPGSPPDRNETARIKAGRASVFLTIYIRPKLFQIPGNLHGVYDFGAFFDKESGAFRLVDDGSPRTAMSYVVPETPFSITDKIPFLKAAGWTRFILDFTPQPLKKTHYKSVMKAAQQGRVIPCARFNWKDGFYQAEALYGSVPVL